MKVGARIALNPNQILEGTIAKGVSKSTSAIDSRENIWTKKRHTETSKLRDNI